MSVNNLRNIAIIAHVDHGKTTLVDKLLQQSGTLDRKNMGTERVMDSDDQEKERGMTIDIGFAFLNNKITIIDMPGHEKFVKNMMSGCSGIDIAILVVAADDGVMPQTREHFEIIKLLNVQHGFVVLNKIDLVDPDWVELVVKDIEDLADGSFM